MFSILILVLVIATEGGKREGENDEWKIKGKHMVRLKLENVWIVEVYLYNCLDCFVVQSLYKLVFDVVFCYHSQNPIFPNLHWTFIV